MQTTTLAETERILRERSEEKNQEFLAVYRRLLEIIKSGDEAFLMTFLDPLSGGSVTLMTVLENGYYRRGLEVRFRFIGGKLGEVDFFLAPLTASYPSYYSIIPGETFMMNCKLTDVAGDDDPEEVPLGKIEVKGVKMRFRDGFAQAGLRTNDVLDFVTQAKARKPARSDYPAITELSEFKYFFGNKPTLGQVREELLFAYSSLGTVLG